MLGSAGRTAIGRLSFKAISRDKTGQCASHKDRERGQEIYELRVIGRLLERLGNEEQPVYEADDSDCKSDCNGATYKDDHARMQGFYFCFVLSH